MLFFPPETLGDGVLNINSVITPKKLKRLPLTSIHMKLF